MTKQKPRNRLFDWRNTRTYFYSGEYAATIRPDDTERCNVAHQLETDVLWYRSILHCEGLGEKQLSRSLRTAVIHICLNNTQASHEKSVMWLKTPKSQHED